MELEVLSYSGLSQSSVISVRSGTTRRQARLSELDRPLKFPNEPDNLKVDLLELIGNSRIAYNSMQTEYRFNLDGPDGEILTDKEVVVAVRPSEKGGGLSETDEDPERALDKKKELVARDYLERHGLTSFMQFLMHSLMKDKPEDPYTFLLKEVTKRVVNTEISKKVGISEAVGDVSTEQLESLEAAASEAGEQLRADNAKLQQTLDELKTHYAQFVKDGDLPKTDDAGKLASVNVVAETLSPAALDESAQFSTYRDIAGIQDEVSALAKENATLVQQLASMMASISSVRGEIDMINKS